MTTPRCRCGHRRGNHTRGRARKDGTRTWYGCMARGCDCVLFMEMRDLRGKVGVCSKGRPGIITGQERLPWGLSWVGFGLDDGTPWASREPRVEAESVSEWRTARQGRGGALSPERGEMTACEKCWSDSATFHGDHGARYAELLRERTGDKACSPEEQAGRYARWCVRCDRYTVHQYAGICTACGSIEGEPSPKGER